LIRGLPGFIIKYERTSDNHVSIAHASAAATGIADSHTIYEFRRWRGFIFTFLVLGVSWVYNQYSVWEVDAAKV
jgi:hypothetical protein